MKLYKICILLLLFGLSSFPVKAQVAVPRSFEQSLQLLHQGDKALKIADQAIKEAKNEQAKLGSFWYPSLQSTGAYVHLSERVEVRQSLSGFTDPAKDYIQSLVPNEQLISSLLDRVGAYTFTVPLFPRNVTTVDLNAEWVLFAGGKRLQATRIGGILVDIAREKREETDAARQALLVARYYGLRLALENVEVRKQTYEALRKHYLNAVKLEEAGMLKRSVRLFAQVVMDEAGRQLEAARKDVGVIESALQKMLDVTYEIVPQSPLFINELLPPREYFRETVYTENYLLTQMKMQEDILGRQIKIDKSAYLPDIALFGQQTLYSHGIESNLVPRTLVGVGFVWNLFDGLDRERKIRQSEIARHTLAMGWEQARDDLSVAVDKLYSELQKAHENVRVLGTTIALSREVVRMRNKEFAEGMATSAEVIDAETLLANVLLARLSALYEYDVVLMNLLVLCGIPGSFTYYSNNGLTESEINLIRNNGTE